MAINPFDKWPESRLKPLNFDKLIEAQALINKSNEDKLDRDVKMYEQMGKLRSTHIPTIPGTQDEAKQREAETTGNANLNKLAEQYGKGQIDYRQMMTGYWNITNDIAGPAAQKRKQNYDSFLETKKQEREHKTNGKWSNLLYGETITPDPNFDSDNGDVWNMTVEPHIGAEVAENLFNNLTPIQDAAGNKYIRDEDLESLINENIKNGRIMSEPFTDQQIRIARKQGDNNRSNEQIAHDVWMARGQEYKQKVQAVFKPTRPTGDSDSGGGHDKPLKAPTPETPYNWGLMNVKAQSPEEFHTYRSDLKSAVETLSQKLVDVSGMTTAEQIRGPLAEAFNNPMVEYIKLPDGHIYDKSDVSSDNPNKVPMDAVYENEVGSLLKSSEDQLAVSTSDNEQILRTLFEKEYGPGSYNTKRPLVIDEDGNFILSASSKEVQSDASIEANKVYTRALERGDLNAGKIFSDTYNEYIENHDPETAKFKKLYERYYNSYFNPPVSIRPTGHIFAADDKMKTDLPELISQYSVYGPDGKQLSRADISAFTSGEKGDLIIKGWATMPKEGVMVQAYHHDAKTGDSDPIYIDITGPQEKAFYQSRGMMNPEEKTRVIKEQVDRLFTEPTASQSGKVYIDGKDFNVVTRNAEKYIGYMDDVTNKYKQIKLGAVDNVALTEALSSISSGQQLYNLDKLTAGLMAAEGGQNIQNLSGSSAQGYFQVIPSLHKDVFIQKGYNPDEPGFSIMSLSFQKQAEIARAIINKYQPSAFNLYTEFGNMPDSPLKSVDDFSWAAYYLGPDGLETWLRTFNLAGLDAANQTIPNYPKGNLGLDVYVNKAKLKADKYSQEQKEKYQ